MIQKKIVYYLKPLVLALCFCVNCASAQIYSSRGTIGASLSPECVRADVPASPYSGNLSFSGQRISYSGGAHSTSRGSISRMAMGSGGYSAPIYSRTGSKKPLFSGGGGGVAASSPVGGGGVSVSSYMATGSVSAPSMSAPSGKRKVGGSGTPGISDGCTCGEDCEDCWEWVYSEEDDDSFWVHTGNCDPCRCPLGEMPWVLMLGLLAAFVAYKRCRVKE